MCNLVTYGRMCFIEPMQQSTMEEIQNDETQITNQIFFKSLTINHEYYYSDRE